MSSAFSQIMSTEWFFCVEFIGMVAFALSGLMMSYQYHVSLLGTVLLCFLPAFGGGLMRDIICGRFPVWFMTAKFYVLLVFVIAVAGFFLLKWITHFQKNHNKTFLSHQFKRKLAFFLNATDAIGLAAFTVIGVFVSFLTKSEPTWIWGPFFAFLTSSGGGILRDLMVKDSHVNVISGEFYGEIALVGGLFLSLYLKYLDHRSHKFFNNFWYLSVPHVCMGKKNIQRLYKVIKKSINSRSLAVWLNSNLC